MEFKPTVNPLLSPRGTYLFQAHLRWWWWWGGGLIETGGIFETEGLVLSKKIKIEIKKTSIQSGKAQVQEGWKKVGGHAAEDQNQIRTSIW